MVLVSFDNDLPKLGLATPAGGTISFNNGKMTLPPQMGASSTPVRAVARDIQSTDKTCGA